MGPLIGGAAVAGLFFGLGRIWGRLEEIVEGNIWNAYTYDPCYDGAPPPVLMYPGSRGCVGEHFEGDFNPPASAVIHHPPNTWYSFISGLESWKGPAPFVQRYTYTTGHFNIDTSSEYYNDLFSGRDFANAKHFPNGITLGATRSVPALPGPLVGDAVPQIDPFSKPPLDTMSNPWVVPVRFAGLIELPNPWRNPNESSSGGYQPPAEDHTPGRPRRPRPPRPRPNWPNKPSEPDVVIPVDPGVPGVQPYRPPVGGSRPPPPGTKEKKFILAVGGMPAKIISFVGESIDVIESIHDALPKKYQAKEPEGWWRGPSPQDMAWAIYDNIEHVDWTAAFNNLVYNHWEDKFFGKIGATGAKANRKTGRFGGLQLGPAM